MAGLEQRHNKRLVLVPFPYEGHLNPMLQLGYILYNRGFSITIVCAEFNSPNPSEHPNFSFLKIPHRKVTPRDFVDVISSLNSDCEVPFKESLAQKMEQDYRYGEIACIIYDTFMYFAEVAAKHLRVPSIILRTGCASNFLTYKVALQLKQDGLIPVPDYLSSNMVPEHHHLRYKDLPVVNSPQAERLVELLSRACQLGSSVAVIWNTLDCLEGSSLAQVQQDYQVPSFPIGPLHKVATPSYSSLHKEDYSCILWLEKQSSNSVVYVSLGSLAYMNKEDLAEMSWGLASSNQPFLWVIRPDLTPDSKPSDFLPEGFSEAVGERGCIVEWAPQKEVLAHRAVGGFWSHCGWNSTMESISEGVPMICQPSFGDQKVNARCLSLAWKVGLAFENEINREEVARVIRKLMIKQGGHEIRQRALDLKDKITLSLQPGGSSYNSLNELVELILSAKQPK